MSAMTIKCINENVSRFKKFPDSLNGASLVLTFNELHHFSFFSFFFVLGPANTCVWIILELSWSNELNWTRKRSFFCSWALWLFHYLLNVFMAKFCWSFQLIIELQSRLAVIIHKIFNFYDDFGPQNCQIRNTKIGHFY